MTLAEDLSIDIGRKIRETRKAAGLSISSLAELAELSPAAVQKIETNRMVPTIVSLMKISRALGRSVGFFVEDGDPARRVALVRSGERRSFYSEASKCRQEFIAGDLSGGILEGGVFTADPGGGSGEAPNSHPGEEIVLCMAGGIHVEVGDQVHRLEPGDSLHFKSDLPHRWTNPGSSPAEVLWIYTEDGAGRPAQS